MSDNVIWSTDFKRPNPKADGPSEDQVKYARELADERRRMWVATTPADYCAPEKDPA